MSALALTLSFASGFGSIKASDAAELNNTEAAEKWKSYVDEEVKKFKFEAYQEAFATFQIDQNEYAYYEVKTKAKDYKEISENVARQLKKSIQEHVLKKLKTGDVMPGIFVHKDGLKAFAVYKSGDTGENHIFWFTLGQDSKSEASFFETAKETWSLDSSDTASGKQVKKLELKSLKEFIDIK